MFHTNDRHFAAENFHHSTRTDALQPSLLVPSGTNLQRWAWTGNEALLLTTISFSIYFTDPLTLLCLFRITGKHVPQHIPNTSPSIDSCNICTLLTSAILIAFKFNFLLPHSKQWEARMHCTHTDTYVCPFSSAVLGVRNVLCLHFLNFTEQATHQTKILSPGKPHLLLAVWASE